MPRKPLTPEQKAEIRSRIQQAASEIYSEGGIRSISARAIAARAKLSTGTLYLHFENLADLMRSLWTGPVAEANERLEEIAKTTRDPVRRVRALLEAYVAFAEEYPRVYRNAILFVRPEHLPKPEQRSLHEFPFFDLLCTALREGQARGKIRKGNVEQLAQVLWASLHGAIALPINNDLARFEAPEKLARDTVQLLMRSIKP